MKIEKRLSLLNFSDFYSCIFIAIFAVILSLAYVHIRGKNLVPLYDKGQYQVISNLKFADFLTPVKYDTYYRFSPSAMLLVGLLDKEIVAPMAGIDFSDQAKVVRADRLNFLFHISLAVSSILLFLALRLFSLPLQGAIVGTAFFTTHKAFYFFFGFMSCLPIYLLLIYALLSIIFFTLYVRKEKAIFLVGYYIFLLLTLLAWEQSLNFFAFLIFTSTVFFILRKMPAKYLKHLAIIPFFLAVAYLTYRLPYTKGEMNTMSEAQQIFSYPAAGLMIEDIFSNAVLHLAQIFEGVLLPYPMQSYSVLNDFNMDTLNPYNATYANGNGSVHYKAFGLLYAGILFPLIIGAMIWTIKMFIKFPKNHFLATGLCGIFLTVFGFLVHLSIMHRAYFLMPGYFIGYKHALSMLGAALWLGSIYAWKQKDSSWNTKKTWMFCCLVCLWFLSTNIIKITLTYPSRLFPW